MLIVINTDLVISIEAFKVYWQSTKSDALKLSEKQKTEPREALPRDVFELLISESLEEGLRVLRGLSDAIKR